MKIEHDEAPSSNINDSFSDNIKLPMDSPTSSNTKSEFECDEHLSNQTSVDEDHGTGVESFPVEPIAPLSSSRDFNEMLEVDASTSFGPTNQNFSVSKNAEGINVSSIADDAPLNLEDTSRLCQTAQILG